MTKTMRANIVFFIGDKVVVFHIVCNNFTVQLQQVTYLFMMGMYCMAHYMNLVVQTLQRHFVGWEAWGFVVELVHSYLQPPKVSCGISTGGNKFMYSKEPKNLMQHKDPVD